MAQAPAPKPIKLGPLTVNGSLRTRVEAWDWYHGAAENAYPFSGSIFRLALGQQAKSMDWQIEMALPVLLGLPDNAVAPGTPGQLGLGATYFVANSRSQNAALPFAKQAFVRFKNLGGSAPQSVRLGRMEFVEGAETVPKNATLAGVKRDRIAHRLIGHFGWTHVGRSFDGLQYNYNTGSQNVTVIGARPTRGVFQTDGWGQLDVALLYGAYTRPLNWKKSAAEFRAFGIYYDDWRAVLKTDARAIDARRADTASLRIGTFGGHYIHTCDTAAGTFDLMFWGALQTGRWGVLDHRAAAGSAEVGYQPRILPRLKPWVRAGLHHGSGDGDPRDGTHNTFFQVLPTPRWLARFPFYNLMNIQDGMVELVLRPHPRVTVRSEAHTLRLANANDFWYQGGGAFQPWTFGYVGRATSGGRSLATLFDVGADYTVNARVTLGAYFAAAQGKSVMQAIYPQGTNARFGYVELGYRF